MRLFVVRLARLLGVWAALGSAAAAVAAEARVDGQTIYVNETPVMILRSGDVSRRAAVAIGAIRRHGDRPTAKATGRGNRVTLLLGSRAVVQIGSGDAQAAGISAVQLGKLWAANLNRALSLPAISLGSSSVQMGNGKEVRIPLTGRLASQAAISSSDGSVVSATRAPGFLVLKGKLAGSAQVAVGFGAIVKYVAVKVVPMAAHFPQYGSATITGLPATGSVAKGAVESAVWNQLKTMPASDVKFTVPEVGPIPMGESRTVNVRVRVIAPDSLPNEGNMTVTVKNLPYRVPPEVELWYCNDPEPLEKFGPVFGASLKKGRPARMLFHHVNEAAKGLFFHAQIVNSSDRPARILLIPGDCPIDKNPVLAGIDAADRFLRNWIQSSGEIVEVAPRSVLPISLKRLAPHETVSGLCYMELLDDGPESVMVRADAKQPFVTDARWSAALQSDAPWRILGSLPKREIDDVAHALTEHIYPEPFKRLEVAYQVGGRHGFVRLGQKPLPNSAGDRYLDGNFGVIYTISANVENPTTISAEVEVVFEASAGYSGAIFALNGQIHRTPLLQPKDERRILLMRIEPGASKQFTLYTMPLSGSSYPATVAIRPVESTTRALAAEKKKLQ